MGIKSLRGFNVNMTKYIAYIPSISILVVCDITSHDMFTSVAYSMLGHMPTLRYMSLFKAYTDRRNLSCGSIYL